eukprot:8413711-Ditylum_brightwellii.AAC.1
MLPYQIGSRHCRKERKFIFFSLPMRQGNLEFLYSGDDALGVSDNNLWRKISLFELKADWIWTMSGPKNVVLWSMS